MEEAEKAMNTLFEVLFTLCRTMVCLIANVANGESIFGHLSNLRFYRHPSHLS